MNRPVIHPHRIANSMADDEMLTALAAKRVSEPAKHYRIDRLTGFDLFCIALAVFVISFFGAVGVSAWGQS